MRAMIVTDEFGRLIDAEFETLVDARRAWRAVPMKYASVLFVQLPTLEWETVKVYGLPLAVSNIVRRQAEKSQRPLPEKVEATSTREVRSSRCATRDGFARVWVDDDQVEVSVECLRAVAEYLRRRDAHLASSPRLEAILSGSGRGSADDGAELAAELSANAFAGPKLSQWLEVRRSTTLAGTLQARTLEPEALRPVLATGCPKTTTRLVYREGATYFGLDVELPGHGVQVRCRPARFAHFAALRATLAARDADVLALISSFPRRHARSKLRKLGSGLGPRELARRSAMLEAFFDDLFDVFTTISVESQRALAEWMTAEPPDVAPDELVEAMPQDKELEEEEPGVKTETTDVSKIAQPPLRARLSSIAEAAYNVVDGALSSYAQSAPAALENESRGEEQVLVFELQAIRGLTERVAGFGAGRARLHVSARTIGECDDDDDDPSSPESIEVSSEAQLSLNPTWDPPFRFTLVLGGDVAIARVLVALHDASSGSSRDDGGIFAYAVLSDLRRFAGGFEHLEVPLVDDENAKTEAAVVGDAWLAPANDVRASRTVRLRRHCVLVYEHRVFSTVFDKLGVGWLMCVVCADFTEALAADRDASDAARWRHYWTCVPDDVRRPFAHVPDPNHVLRSQHSPPSSFDALSPLADGERLVKPWHMVHTEAQDPSGWAYATSITATLWYPEMRSTSLYRRSAWYRYSTTDPAS